METEEANTTSSPKPQSNQPLLESVSSDVFEGFAEEEEALSQRLENVRLGSNEDESIESLPLRPYAEDCQFYVRKGTCKFGLNCRYNHPVRRVNHQKAGKEKEKFSEKPEEIECKYYLTQEGCKYGKFCRYNHSKEESEIAPPELNFLGLPIRVGEKECPFYMRNGSCGYGAHCKFHHPDPTDIGGYDPHNSTWESQKAQASWSTQMLSDKAVPYPENHTSYIPTMHFLPQEALQTPEWNGYQASNYPDDMARHPHSTPAMSLTSQAYISSQLEEFPERPGQPECEYFIRTGYCKYKSACRYHHPKHQFPKAECVLSDNGLPLRPGKKICRHYDEFGICKFGRACLFDHPVNHISTFAIGSALGSL
ncbi:Zinc finger CCCH domain-containing protein [Actinidia chinensis var. chinensis]|uniref:Zinc finger CCCH domain-containing protein n=1 Tax=Actinidia chinensis var. chinensis TaxID=1590841 RepID=A0A2R6RZ09_ACTCC|nr:Zinc finger CCCH domain-containing protein [Actinidia chinensis var. chinensis]